MLRLVKKYWAVFCVGLVVFRVRLLLRVWSLPRVLVALSPARVTGARNDSVMDDVTYYVDCWFQVAPYNRKGNSFPRSLALYWFARRMGYPVQFHCGVRMGYLHMEGHAWLTWNGEPFREMTRQWEMYTITYSYPPDTALAGTRTEAVLLKSNMSPPL
jgi:hypothetical protein